MADRRQAFLNFVADEAKKWATRVAFAGLAALLVLLFTPWKERLAAIWNAPDQLSQILSRLDSLASDVQRATGEDRVLFEVPGLTYVTEPVFVGDRITLNLVVRRTRVGDACTAISRTALFTDVTNIATPGATVQAQRQISTTDTPLRVQLDVPPQVQPGRVTVHLSIEFDCGGKRVFDTTRPTAFMLLHR